MKKLLAILLSLTMIFIAVACAAAPAATEPAVEAPAATEAPAVTEAPAATEEAGLELTLEELAKFNGKDGQPAYVAVDGIIYDVSASAFWKDGQHNGFEAGKDLTTEIKEKSPHGIAKLANVVEVGKLVTK